VVEEISREMSKLSTFVTLSPVPNFADWLRRERANEASPALNEGDRAALAILDQADWWQHSASSDLVREPLLRAAGWYFLRARSRHGTPLDPVARFHLGNGARLERLDWLADTSPKALGQSFGLMVNYLYDLGDIEKNHEAYAEQRSVVASSAVTRLVRAPALDLVPTSG
jgi:malonyl-CoA decarboxylase